MPPLARSRSPLHQKGNIEMDSTNEVSEAVAAIRRIDAVPTLLEVLCEITGMRLAIGFGVSSLVVAAIGPSVKAAGFPTLLMSLAGVAACTLIAISFLPNEREVMSTTMKPAE